MQSPDCPIVFDSRYLKNEERKIQTWRTLAKIWRVWQQQNMTQFHWLQSRIFASEQIQWSYKLYEVRNVKHLQTVTGCWTFKLLRQFEIFIQFIFANFAFWHLMRYLQLKFNIFANPAEIEMMIVRSNILMTLFANQNSNRISMSKHSCNFQIKKLFSVTYNKYFDMKIVLKETKKLNNVLRIHWIIWWLLNCLWSISIKVRKAESFLIIFHKSEVNVLFVTKKKMKTFLLFLKFDFKVILNFYCLKDNCNKWFF